MKVNFRFNVNVNEDGQIVVALTATDLPPGYDLTIPTLTLTRAQAAALAGMVCHAQGLVCAHCGKAPPVAEDEESAVPR